jgi:hypothetical protein
VDSEEAMVAMVEEAMQSVAYIDRFIQRDDHVMTSSLSASDLIHMSLTVPGVFHFILLRSYHRF